MSAEYGNEYILGENVTDLFLSKKPRETVVVSVRLPITDFKRLDKVINDSGKSLSQVVREAIALYTEQSTNRLSPPQFGMSLQPSEGGAFSVGQVDFPTSSPCIPSITGIPEANLSSDRI